MSNTKRGKVIVTVGGQYGSCSKGQVVGELAFHRDVGAVVRTGAINAGHTVYYDGKPYAFQQVPVGWVNPFVKLVIGRGAYVNREVLERECKLIQSLQPNVPLRDRLFVDSRCFVHLEEFKTQEKTDDLHHKIGSTAEGVAAAMHRKIERNPKDKLLLVDQPWSALATNLWTEVDTVEVLSNVLESGKNVLIEGTQGALLDLHFGYYPFVTSRCTNASAWLAECGLPPVNVETVLVFRTYPIRVAGNSGYMRDEMGWVELLRRINIKLAARGLPPRVDEEVLTEFRRREVALMDEFGMPRLPHEMRSYKERDEFRVGLSEFYKQLFQKHPDLYEKMKPHLELTTVTKKLRRVAEFDWAAFYYVLKLNRPTHLVMNFLNYEFPQVWGRTESTPEVDEYLKKLEKTSGARVLGGTTSPTTTIKYSTY